MNHIPKILTRAVLGAALALGAAASAIAQAWPSKPVHIIVPYAPGGAGDTLARGVGKKMGEILGQPVLIDNKPGGSGNIGITEGLKAPADGYTITFVAVPYVITQFVYPKLAYDGPKDFIPLGLLQTAPLVLVVNPSLNIKTPTEDIQAAKARPGQNTYATSGSGSVTHTKLLPAIDDRHCHRHLRKPDCPSRCGRDAPRSVAHGDPNGRIHRSGRHLAIDTHPQHQGPSTEQVPACHRGASAQAGFPRR